MPAAYMFAPGEGAAADAQRAKLDRLRAAAGTDARARREY